VRKKAESSRPFVVIKAEGSFRSGTLTHICFAVILLTFLEGEKDLRRMSERKRIKRKKRQHDVLWRGCEKTFWLDSPILEALPSKKSSSVPLSSSRPRLPQHRKRLQLAPGKEAQDAPNPNSPSTTESCIRQMNEEERQTTRFNC